MDGPIDLLGQPGPELAQLAKRHLPSGHGIWREIYRDALRGEFEPERYGLNERSAAGWRAHFRLELPKVVRVLEEPTEGFDDTVKLVLRTQDGMELESVRIPMGGDRYTLCVSSQVGCKLACAFCETGKMGLLRDLTVPEIIGQVVVGRSLGKPIRNIVFMGMGEPLDNLDNLVQALKVLNDQWGLSFGQERITVCTAGVPAGLERLGRLGWKRLDLAISLNAAEDTLRDRLMPINRRHNLAELQAALVAYPRRKSFVYAINYCLMPGINDRPEDAVAVAEFCRPLQRALVNLIPYNPGSSPLTRAPAEEEIERFITWLKDAGALVRRRVTKGRSSMAACGQLGNVELRKQRAALKVVPP
ncbi:MAG: 23S rRNA (adenine(2503)-C(2))-methyltransferase RlmN [Deltaproteobacteria bacterium]|nr:23S rRNA (adenine(2503)-C(2))-methyltransferase RlmN [Deltaproteobacteria bacterium]